ncbi:MAG: hypothetical protein EA428_13240 [Spirochaetaceae bacterium]|nr:MAG: hypothetical protein EA428_13240 [Spirochaetaceae bacterium]
MMRMRLIFHLLILLPLFLLLAGPGLLPAQGPPADLSDAWLLQQGPVRRTQINFMNAAIDHQFLVYSKGTREVELVYTREAFAAPDDWQAFSCPGLTLSVSRRPERLVSVYTHDNNRHFIFAFSVWEDERRVALDEPDCSFVGELLSEFRFFGGLTARESVPAPFPAAF